MQNTGFMALRKEGTRVRFAKLDGGIFSSVWVCSLEHLRLNEKLKLDNLYCFGNIQNFVVLVHSMDLSLPLVSVDACHHRFDGGGESYLRIR